jgi:anti-sigma factor RsiW
MRCIDYRHWLSPYVDGQLEQARRTELDAHLTGCAACQAELASLQEMLRVLRTMERPEVPELLPGIHAKLGRRPWWEAALRRFVAPWPSSLPWHGLALATAAVLVVVLARVRQAPELSTIESKPTMMAQLKQKDTDEPFDAQERSVVVERLAAVAGRMQVADAIQPSAGTKLAESIAEEGTIELGLSQMAAETVPPISAVWRVADPAAALSAVSVWISTRSGSMTMRDERHVEIRLAASDVSEFLQRFSTPPPAKEEVRSKLNELDMVSSQPVQAPLASRTGGASAAPPSLVVISLELLPSE